MKTHQQNRNQTTEKPSNNIIWLLSTLILIIIFTSTMSVWLLTTPAGAQWLLSMVSRISSGSVVFAGVNGTVGALRTTSIHFTNEDLQLTVHNFALDWQPEKIFSGQLKIQRLSAQNIHLLSPPSKEPPSPIALPDNLQLPISISVEQLKIAVLRVFSKKADLSGTPDFSATNISAQLQSNGHHHQLTNLRLNSDFGALNASVSLDGTKPFNLDANVKFTSLTKLAEKQLPTTQFLAAFAGDLTQLNVNIIADGELFNGNADITLRPFAPFPVTALHMSLEGLNPKTFSPDAPGASISLQTNMRENGTKALTGKITIKNSQAASLDHGGIPLHEVSANLAVSSNFLQLEDLLIHLTDNGIISGNLFLEHAQSYGSANLTVSQLNPLVLNTRLQPARINGNINLHGDTKKQRGIIALKDETLTLDTEVSHTDQVVTLENFQLRRRHSALNGQGKLNLDEHQLFDFEGKLTQFNLSDFAQAPNSNLNLALKLTGNLSPQIAGSASFKFENSKLAAQSVSGGGMVEFNYPDQVKGDIGVKIGSNSLRVNGDFGQPGDRMQLDITAPALAQIETRMSGAFNLKADLAGSFASPEIHFKMTGSNLTLPGNHYLHHLSAHGHHHDESISLNIIANDYRAENKEQLQHLSIVATGEKSRHQIQARTQINDEIVMDLQTKGGLTEALQNDATMQWIGELTQLSVTSPLPFNLKRAAKLELSQKRLFLEGADLAVANGKLSIDNILWTPQQWHTQGKFTGISLRPGELLERDQQTLQLGGKWNIASSNNVISTLQIARETGDWVLPGDFPLALGLQTLQFATKTTDGKLDANLSVKGERIGITNAQVSIPLTASDATWTILPNAPITAQLATNINDISWIGKIFDENIKSGGKFSLQTKLTGTLEKPELQGTVNGENLALTLLDQGLRLEQGKLDAHFDHASLKIDTLKFTAPDETPPNDHLLTDLKLTQKEPGNLAISGKIGLTGNESNLKIKLDRVPLAHESNYWILASGGINTRFNEKTLAIKGKIIADAGLIAQPPTGRPQLADDIIIGKQPSLDSNGLILNLDATLDLGKHFYIRASGLEGKLVGQLHLGTDQRQKLIASGSIATSKTNFKAYGQKLAVKRGIVNFTGPLDDPGLNILAIRKDLPVEAGVEVLGTVRRPKVRLVSNPTVPDAEKLSWIVFGRSLKSDGVDASLLLAAAGSILGGQPGDKSITDQLSQSLGVDKISFRQSGTGGNLLTSQIGTVGKRLSSRAYLSYERGLTTASAGVTKLTYSLTPRIRIVTRAGMDSALDVFYTFQFD